MHIYTHIHTLSLARARAISLSVSFEFAPPPSSHPLSLFHDLFLSARTRMCPPPRVWKQKSLVNFAGTNFLGDAIKLPFKTVFRHKWNPKVSGIQKSPETRNSYFLDLNACEYLERSGEVDNLIVEIPPPPRGYFFVGGSISRAERRRFQQSARQ